MSNSKTRGFITLLLALVLVFCFSSVVFADNEIKSYTLTATYNGKTINNGDQISIRNSDSPRKVSVTVNPQYVDSSLKIYYTFSGHTQVVENGRGILATGSKTASYNVPTDLIEGAVYTMNLESTINDGTDAYWAKSNILQFTFKVESDITPSIEVNLKDGSKTISHNSHIEKEPGSKLTLQATSNVDVEFVMYIWDLDQSTKKTVNGSSATITVPNITAGQERRLDIQGKLIDPTGKLTDKQKYSASKTFYIKAPEAEPESITITLKDNGSNIVATNSVSNGTFDHYEYHWNTNSAQTQTSGTFGYPINPGTYTLYVKGVTKSGLKSAEKSVQVTIQAEQPEETVTCTLKDNGEYIKASNKVTNGTFDHYEYHWNSNSAQTQTSDVFGYPVNPGTYTLYVKAVTNSGKKSAEQSVTVTIKQQEEPEVTGTISASVPSGKLSEDSGKPTSVTPDTVVTAKFNPESNFVTYEYKWDNESYKPLPSDRKINVPNFDPGTTHKLTIRGVLTNGNEVLKIYYITIPQEEEGELDIDPWMVENNNGEGLVVALRTASDTTKANKNYFMIDEEVIYKVDYKNFGKDITDEVKLVLNVPLKFEIVDSDGGVVDSSKKTITWTYPNGLSKDAEDTKVVKLKYKELSKSSLKSEMIYPQAVIYKKSKAEDYSSVINCIYLDEDTKLGVTHDPYMYGDLEAPTFRPDEGISRAEGAMVLLRIFDENYTNVKTITDKYSDIEDTYYVARQAITKATQLNVMSGYPDGTFKPNEKMTRAEFMRVIASYIEESAKVKGLEIKDSDAVVIYKDKSHWSNPYVTLLARLNMTSASSKEKDLRVDAIITRAEVAQLCNFFLFRAPAKVTNSTKMEFEDVSRSHKLIADIVEATRESHSFTVTEDGKEVASK